MQTGFFFNNIGSIRNSVCNYANKDTGRRTRRPPVSSKKNVRGNCYRHGTSGSIQKLKRSLAIATLVLATASSSNDHFFVDGSNAASAAMGALKNMDYRYFVAGGTCAAFSHGITTPIDVVKTKLQADPEKFEGKGLVAATLQICRDKNSGGSAALLNGLGPTVLGYGIEGAMKFGAYEVTKPLFLTLLGERRKVTAFVLSSIVAGSIAAVLLVPMESLRIKQVTDDSYKDDTILSGIPRIIRDDGFLVMMSGVWAMLAKQVPYTFGKQVSFDLVAKFLYSVTETLSVLTKTQLKWIVSLLSAFCASIAACLCSQPGDMILTDTYSSSRSKPGSFGTVVRGIYGKGGLPGFFRGTQARLVHVGMIITSQLMVYDLVKQLLGLPATGSH
ncbi:unnamed protein product [Pseudo-nitzschia multistriata]|uniref:Mitochondrial carrier protein n=1 Tax=Pseudo-nitzschia multistriata TaxID=183589 RepID=A0A448YZE7_9STRA|nr:unnamed protein product [Pseudo-nitzschia multistriata]